MFKKISLTALNILFLMVIFTPKILAHGSKITYQQIEALEIVAKYDNGKPMAKAQVIIYAPNDLTKPWLNGVTDDQGKFMFTPDYSLVGNWNVKVRLAGHGKIINIPISSSSVSSDLSSKTLNQKDTETALIQSQVASERNDGQLTLLQKLMMAATGVWGFIGTALFFSRKNS